MEGGTKLCRTSTQCPKPLMQTGPPIKSLRPRLGGGSHTGSEVNSGSRVSIFSRGMAVSKDLCRDHGKALASRSTCLQHAVKGLLLRSAPRGGQSENHRRGRGAGWLRPTPSQPNPPEGPGLGPATHAALVSVYNTATKKSCSRRVSNRSKAHLPC